MATHFDIGGVTRAELGDDDVLRWGGAMSHEVPLGKIRRAVVSESHWSDQLRLTIAYGEDGASRDATLWSGPADRGFAALVAYLRGRLPVGVLDDGPLQPVTDLQRTRRYALGARLVGTDLTRTGVLITLGCFGGVILTLPLVLWIVSTDRYRLVTDAAGLTVRGLRTQRVAWASLTGVDVVDVHQQRSGIDVARRYRLTLHLKDDAIELVLSSLDGTRLLRELAARQVPGAAEALA